jgi:hypothetical protein
LFFVPLLVKFLGVYLDGFEAFSEGEISRAISDEHDVGRFLHDAAGGGDGVEDAFDGGDAAGVVAGAIHDAGVLLDHSGGVWESVDSDGAVFFVGFDEADSLFDGVEEGALVIEGFEGFVVAGFAEGPGGDDEWFGHGRVVVGTEGVDRCSEGETGGEEVAAGVGRWHGMVKF